MSTGANLYNINNTGGYPLTILDNAGNILGFAYPYNAVAVGLASNSTAAGVWNLSGHELLAYTAQVPYDSTLAGAAYTIKQVIAIDSTRELLLFSQAANLYGVVYNSSTQTFGSSTLITSTYGYNSIGILSATNQILLVGNNNSTTLGAAVLTISGTTITVGSFTTQSISAWNTASGNNLIAVGTSWLLSFATATTNHIVAMTISGTTVTTSSQTTLTGSCSNIYLTAINSSTVLAVTLSVTSSITACPYTISGTTITAGTAATVSSLLSTYNFRVLRISNGTRWVMVYLNGAGTSYAGSLISVSGTTATLSTVNMIAPATASTDAILTTADMMVNGSKLIIYVPTVGVQILTDTAGTASVGTLLTVPDASSVTPQAIMANSSTASFVSVASNNTLAFKLNINISGASATLTSIELMKITAAPNGYGATWAIASSFNGTKSPNTLTGSVVINYQGPRLVVLNTGTNLVYWGTKFALESASNSTNGANNNEVWMGLSSSTYPFMRLQSIT